MKFETAAVHTGEEVLAQPRNQNCQRAKAEGEERNQEGTPVIETELNQAVIPLTEAFKGLLKALLNPYQRVSGGRGAGLLVIAAQEILRDGWDDRPGEKVRRQHGASHGLGERHKETSRYAGQQKHRSKHDTDRKRGHERGCCNLRSTVQDDFVHVLLRFRVAIAIDVLDFDCSVVN